MVWGRLPGSEAGGGLGGGGEGEAGEGGEGGEAGRSLGLTERGVSIVQGAGAVGVL